MKRAIEAFGTPYPYVLTPQLDPQTGEYELHISGLKSIPVDWSLIVGDILHALRSSLDSLCYALSIKHSGSLTEPQEKAIQFPICDTPGHFADDERRYPYRLGLMDPNAKAMVKALQPCFSPHSFTTGNPLSLLRDLHNIDKHRHLVLAYLSLHSGNVEIHHPSIPGGMLHVDLRSQLLQNGAILASYSMPPTVKHPNVDMTSGLGLEITFADGRPAKKEPVYGFLERTYYYIRTGVIPSFASFL